MDTIELAPPEIMEKEELTVAGLRARYAYTDCRGIPAQWVRFRALAAEAPELVAEDHYGVCCAADREGEMDYIAGMGVAEGAEIPDTLERLTVPPQRYAVFACPQPISEIQAVVSAIWCRCLPASGHTHSGGPSLEHYDTNYDPETGTGGFEIWVPVAD